jgi:hypothetical protein
VLKQLLPGLIAGVIGGFVAGFAKFFWDRWLPDRLNWQREQRVEREKLMAHFSGPAVRALHDLENRILGTVKVQALGYDEIKRDGHKQYYVDATTFQIAQCCAWIEILRDKMGALDYAGLIQKLEEVSASLASPMTGFRLFRLEQREIGERMTSIVNGEITCLGYSDFLDALNREKPVTCFSVLRERVELLLESWPQEVVKLIRIQRSLLNAIAFIDEKCRWVPRNERLTLDADQILNRLLTEQTLSSIEFETQRNKARDCGLID